MWSMTAWIALLVVCALITFACGTVWLLAKPFAKPFRVAMAVVSYTITAFSIVLILAVYGL